MYIWKVRSEEVAATNQPLDPVPVHSFKLMEVDIDAKSGVQSLGLHIAAVSYEGSLFGWDAVKSIASDEKELSISSNSSLTDQEGSLVLKFGFHCSVGSLRAVAVSKSGKYLVCGGMNERIQIFDLSLNKSLGELSQHTGAITALEFYGDSYLLSGGEDNAVCIWRVNDWMCVHILGGHKDIVHDLSIHNSGKLALSVSKDNTMKLWNLVEGRCAFTRRMKSVQPATQVSWNNSGDHYLLVTGSVVQIFAAADNSCTASLTQRSRVNKATFTPSISKIRRDIVSSVDSSSNSSSSSSSGNSGGHLLILCEDRSLHLHTTSGDKVSSVEFPEEMKRTRDMSVCRVNCKNQEEQYLYAVTVITSVGSVIVVNLAGMFDEAATFESIYYASFSLKIEPRLTCVTSWTNTGKKKKEKGDNKDRKKRKAADEDNKEAVHSAPDIHSGTGQKKRVSFGKDEITDNGNEINQVGKEDIKLSSEEKKQKKKNKNKKKSK